MDAAIPAGVVVAAGVALHNDGVVVEKEEIVVGIELQLDGLPQEPTQKGRKGNLLMADVSVDTSNMTPSELLAQGVKAFVLQDFDAAVAALSKASEILVRDAVPRNNEEDSGDDDEEQVENGEENGDENGKKENGVEAETGEQEKTEENAEEVSKEGASSTSKTPKDEASGSDKPEEKPDTEEEPTDLQVAWEVLELAKKIFQKLGDDGKKNLAETLTVLGEISLESENFESAVNDIKEGLEIQKQLFGPDSRTIAETFYKLGVAYATNSEIEEAVQSFQGSLDHLRNRIAHLEKLEDKKDEAEDELKDIQSLIPDIEEKIADMKSYKAEALKKIVSAVTEGKTSDGASTSSSAVESKPVTNISHLVKRKRKADDITDEKDISEANPNKKVNQ
ncbi:unnamed protein product [Phaedon cochleariae]|uniref:Tetratricopeptide SHNi-TPR domain-containing protein n=1 Tax=Phaedon cochleariae TaxID=80249 RepID=A0A9N9SBI8_PHACE|nr:unnamed protein product [Phaedon cochleariae]